MVLRFQILTTRLVLPLIAFPFSPSYFVIVFLVFIVPAYVVVPELTIRIISASCSGACAVCSTGDRKLNYVLLSS